ncbi:hypothetical protein SUGI_1125060 [Cryptomeria japonica]|nr:hypothetical protein SUGI_1125060 [Cryptomeria japonica]
MGALPESFDTSNYINANENNSIAKKNSIYASGNSKDTNGNGNHIAFGIPHMQQLFEEQRKYLNYFFSHVEYAEVQAFAQVLMDAKGVIFFTGVGKSGFVAQKITQTFVSTGTKAVFLSPTDALHGDIGIVGSNDVLVLFSKSGTTEELLRLVPCARAKAIQMLFGDTVAIFLMQAKNMTRDQYALNHPAGRIGKRLIFRVQDVMKRQDELPLCKENDLIMDQLVELTSKGCGCLLVVDDEDHLLGTFTDGDLRRTLKSVREGVFKITVGQMCNRNPRSIGPNAMAVEAMQKMESPPSPVQFLPVVDHNNVVIGIVTLHGLVSAGL